MNLGIKPRKIHAKGIDKLPQHGRLVENFIAKPVPPSKRKKLKPNKDRKPSGRY